MKRDHDTFTNDGPTCRTGRGPTPNLPSASKLRKFNHQLGKIALLADSIESKVDTLFELDARLNDIYDDATELQKLMRKIVKLKQPIEDFDDELWEAKGLAENIEGNAWEMWRDIDDAEELRDDGDEESYHYLEECSAEIDTLANLSIDLRDLIENAIEMVEAPRKRSRRTKRHYFRWVNKDIALLRHDAGGCNLKTLCTRLHRKPATVRAKASQLGISLRKTTAAQRRKISTARSNSDPPFRSRQR